MGFQQEHERTAQIFYQSLPRPSNVILGDPRAQVLGLESLSLRIPQHVLETPVTILQRKIEKSLGNQFQEQMGAFQWSMLDAFNKLAATVSKPTPDPTPLEGDQSKVDPKPGPNSVPNQAHQDPGIS